MILTELFNRTEKFFNALGIIVIKMVKIYKHNQNEDVIKMK